MGMPSKYILPINPTGILNTNYEGSVFTYTVGETVIFGQLCYFSGTSFMLADNTQARSVVMCTENKSAGQSCKFLREGFLRNDSWAWIPGDDLWIGATPGSITNVKPSGGGNVLQYIGYAVTATSIHFVPAPTSESLVNIDPSTAAGQFLFGDDSAGYTHSETNELFWDDANKRFGVGTTTPRRKLDVLDTTDHQFRLTYTDGVAFADFRVDPAGNLDVHPTGSIISLNDGADEGVQIYLDASNWIGNMTNNKWFSVTGGSEEPRGGSFIAYGDSAPGTPGGLLIRAGSDTETLTTDYIVFSRITPSTAIEYLRLQGGNNVIFNRLNSDMNLIVETSGSGSQGTLWVDGGNDKIGIGVTPTSPSKFEIRSTDPQIRCSYDAANYFTMKADSVGAVKIVSTNPRVQINDRFIIAPSKTIVEGVATGIFEVALPANSMSGGRVDYTVTSTNGIDFQSHTGTVSWAAVDKGGAITTDVATATGGSGLEVTALSSGSLADVWTCVAGIGKITLTQNASSNLAGTITMVTTFTITNNLANAITLL